MNAHRVPALLALRVLCAVALFAMVVPAAATGEAAPPPTYRYWFAYATDKVYPTSAPPVTSAVSTATPLTMKLTAALGEFEGRQLALRPGVAVQDVWIEPTDLTATDASGNVSAIAASNVSVYKVGYVKISVPSRGYSRKGVEPDPLLPMTLANGEKLGWRPGLSPYLPWRGASAGVTQPFYVNFRVPADAAPGAYTGTLKVTCSALDGTPADELDVPVSLTVYPFSIDKRTLKTSFGANLQWAAYTNSAAHGWLGINTDPGPTRIAEHTTYKADQMGGWLRYFSDHRITPQFMLPAWDAGSDWAPPDNAGNMTPRSDVLADYMSTGAATTFSGNRFQFSSAKMPEYGAPSYVANPFASSSNASKAAQYWRTMRAGLAPYLDKAIAYPIDEPKATARTFVQNYGAFVHRYAPGVKFFVTTDPVTMKYTLLSNVDLYGQKLQFYFRDWGSWVKKIRTAHKNVWIYSHATTWQGVVPAYLIDQPLAASRVQGWMAFKTRADGLLYFNVSAWRPYGGSSAFRDPYKDPLSYRSGSGSSAMYANGDGSLVYPGYYPALGLYVEGAPPVGSLRMEAVRDGLEDYEYLKLEAARNGYPAADAFALKIVGAVPKPVSGKLLFPAWQKTASSYQSVKTQLAADIMK